MKRLWFWFQSLSRFKQIGVCVLIAHAVVILMLSVNHVTSRRLKPRKPIAIRMALATSPEIKKAKTTEKRSINKSEQKPPPKAKSPAIEKKQEVKKLMAPKKTAAAPESKKKTAPVAEGASINNELLEQIASSLDAIASSSKVLPKAKFAVDLPSSIEVQNQVRASVANPGYGETISAILQSNLDLPEYGEVVAKIEIDASGFVTQCEIIETKSRKNADFIKKRLQELAFPCFNEFGLTETRINFTITFHNDEYR